MGLILNRPKRSTPRAWTGSKAAVALALAVGMLGALVAEMPASWVASHLNSSPASRLQLLDARGTLWNGSAQLALAGGADSRDRLALPGRLAWSLGWRRAETPQPPSTERLPFGPTLTLRHSQAMPQPAAVHIGLGWQQLSLNWMLAPGQTASMLALPAAWLAGLGAPWNTLHPGGELQLSVKRLVLRLQSGTPPEFDLDLHLALRDLNSRVSTLPVLGSYGLHAQGRQELNLSLNTQDGSALILEGRGLWRRGGRLEFQGIAQAATGQEAALSNLLNIIGRRDGPRSLIQL